MVLCAAMQSSKLNPSRGMWRASENFILKDVASRATAMRGPNDMRMQVLGSAMDTSVSRTSNAG